jgi:uncharacterized cysteine cluster protein YcgN (CxxCxxCC family)
MPFWDEKSLTKMNRKEWESLCDHCGKCCLMKLQDVSEDEQAEAKVEDNQDPYAVFYTNIVCDLFNPKDASCTDYWNRETRVPTCLRLTQDNLEQIDWMPPSCAYRRILEGQGLADWHHLVSGDKNTIHQTGNSVLGKVTFEKEINPENDDEYPYEEHIVEWPLH